MQRAHEMKAHSAQNRRDDATECDKNFVIEYDCGCGPRFGITSGHGEAHVDSLKWLSSLRLKTHERCSRASRYTNAGSIRTLDESKKLKAQMTVEASNDAPPLKSECEEWIDTMLTAAQQI